MHFQTNFLFGNGLIFSEGNQFFSILDTSNSPIIFIDNMMKTYDLRDKLVFKATK